MRIAYLSIGGHIHTIRWLNYFVRGGHDIHLITVQPVPMENVKVYDLRDRMPTKPLHYAYGLLRLKRMLGRIKPDLLHVHFLTGYGYWGAFSGFHPMILTVWGDDVYFTPKTSFLKSKLARFCLRRADVVTGDSEDIVAECVKMGAPKERSYVIQWGVELEKFSPSVRADVRKSLGIAPEQPIVLSTRSFTQPYYNIDVILEAMVKVFESFPDSVLVVAGNEGDDKAFREMADRFGIYNRCRFVGRIPHQRLPDYLVSSDVFITVPSVDSTAVSLLEAMACGVAVIASDLASNREWIMDGQSGLLVRPRDPEGLACAIERLLCDRELRRELGSRARQIVEEKADYEANMKKMEEICMELVEEYRR